jgi:hypothetical protein
MNRAWIPAGALAGVSVAGLFALGHITDSLGTQVDFPQALVAPKVNNTRPPRPVEVSLDVGKTGSTRTAALKIGGRGGQAAATPSPVSGEAGQAGYRIPSTSTSTAPSTSPAPPTTHSSPDQSAKPKKTQQRQNSIGAISGPNADQGLATGASNGPTGRGEQSSKLAPDTP